MQRELPAGLVFFFGHFPSRFDDVGRQAGEIGLVGNEFGKGIGGVEQVLRELGSQLRQAFLQRLEARFLAIGQLGAR